MTRKRKLKTHDSAKTTHSNLKKRRENENFVLGYDTDPDDPDAHPTLASGTIKKLSR